MTTIYLHGEMADIFGPVWRLAVSSVGEAIRAIEANRGGLEQYLHESGDRGIAFKVEVNEQQVTTKEECMLMRRIETIRISPVVRGSKDKAFGLILGAVLIITAIALPHLGALGAKMASATIFGTKLTTVVGMMGVSMAISGVATLLADTPKGPASIDEGKQSYLFDGPENTVTQGGPVPLCYGGPILVGSQVISAGIYTEDTSTAGSPFDNNGDPWDLTDGRARHRAYMAGL